MAKMKDSAVRDFSPPESASSLSSLPLRGLALIMSPPLNGSSSSSRPMNASPPPDNCAYMALKLSLTALYACMKRPFFLDVRVSIRSFSSDTCLFRVSTSDISPS